MILNGLVLAASTTAARLAGSLGLFALAARGFGPGLFSEFAYAYAIGVFAGAMSDYGFAAQVIKDCSGTPVQAASAVANKLFTSKCLSSFLAFILGTAYLVTTGASSDLPAATLIVFSGVQTSLIDFNSSILKSRLCFKQDLLTTMVNSVVFNILAGAVAFFSKSILLTSLVLVLGRTVSLRQSISGIKNASGIHLTFPFRINLSSFFQQLKNGISYAVDSFAIQGFAALDTFAAKHLLLQADAGIYLTGTRLTQAALSGHAVISSVFLPSIGPGQWSSKVKIKRVIAMAVSASAAGFFIFFIFTAARTWLPEIIFGKAFSELSHVLPYFGIYVLMRYVNILPTSWLTMNGRQHVRTRINLGTLLAAALAIIVVQPDTQLLLIQIMCATTSFNTLIQYTTWIIISKPPQRA